MKASSAVRIVQGGSAWAADPSSLRASRAHQGGLDPPTARAGSAARAWEGSLARERRHLDVDAFLLQHSHLVLERLVRVVERVLQLVPGENHVVGLGSSVGRCSGSSHGRFRPGSVLAPLDPEDDPLGRTTVVEARHNARQAPGRRGPAHGARIQSLREPPRRLHQESLRHYEELERAHRCLHHSRARPGPNARGHPRRPVRGQPLQPGRDRARWTGPRSSRPSAPTSPRQRRSRWAIRAPAEGSERRALGSRCRARSLEAQALVERSRLGHRGQRARSRIRR